VIPGAYEVFYTVYRNAPSTPSNMRADIRCFSVP